jgi:glycosyltransferase involved in cell wall biosynthesis
LADRKVEIKQRKPLRILHVLAGLNPGGAESLVLNICRSLDKTKIQFDFILFSKEECTYNNEIRKLGAEIFYIPRYNGINHFIFKKAWINFFKKNPQYSIIHGHVRSTAAIYLKIAKNFNLTTIAHSHNTGSRGNQLDIMVKYLLQFPIKYTADHLFACSYEAGKWLYGKNATKKGKFKIINNGIDTKKFAFSIKKRNDMRNKLGVNGKYVIGHVGSFTYQKNHSFLLDIFNEICELNDNTVLLLIGDGELRIEIEDKINNLGINNKVIITGVKENIHEFLQAMDVFVFPSIFEGLGIALIEAQAAGLPCIISERIPIEAHLTDLINQVSLKRTPQFWANSVLNYLDYKRTDKSNDIANRGYDIISTSDVLEEFYLSAYNSLKSKL